MDKPAETIAGQEEQEEQKGQVCPTCGKHNTSTQTTWRACCLLSYDFGSDRTCEFSAGRRSPTQQQTR
jgi:hypothetical protein